MPVVQVACVEYVFVFNMNSPRYAGISGTESMYRDEVVSVAFSPSQVCRYAFRSGTSPTVDVAGEDDFLFPVGYGQVQDFRIEMVLMEMAGQKVDAFMRCGQCPFHDTVVGIPPEIKNQDDRYSFEHEAAVINIS